MRPNETFQNTARMCRKAAATPAIDIRQRHWGVSGTSETMTVELPSMRRHPPLSQDICRTGYQRGVEQQRRVRTGISMRQKKADGREETN